MQAHLIDLFHAHAVLAGDRSAYRNAKFEDLATQFFGALQFSGFVGVVKYQGMKITVAGVKYIGNG